MVACRPHNKPLHSLPTACLKDGILLLWPSSSKESGRQCACAADQLVPRDEDYRLSAIQCITFSVRSVGNPSLWHGIKRTFKKRGMQESILRDIPKIESQSKEWETTAFFQLPVFLETNNNGSQVSRQWHKPFPWVPGAVFWGSSVTWELLYFHFPGPPLPAEKLAFYPDVYSSFTHAMAHYKISPRFFPRESTWNNLIFVADDSSDFF